MLEDEEVLAEPVSCGLCRLPAGSSRVVDTEEEVFLLYTSVASRNVQDGEHAFRGLGYLDSHLDVLTLEFSVRVANDTQGDAPVEPQGRKHHSHKKRKRKAAEDKVIEVQLAQDKTALRSRKGDTGSVLWRASMEFAQVILRQWYGRVAESLLDRESLSKAHVLELGAGTGLLSVVLSPLVQHYTVTDIAELVPLMSKNLALNDIEHDAPSIRNTAHHVEHAPVTVDALDWLAVHDTPPSSRHTLLSYPLIDLLLVVDCIYHPSLLPALVGTIDSLAEVGKTTVLVVVELRAEDVVREFLQLWTASGGGTWEIWHAHEAMNGPYAVWVGRKIRGGGQ